MGAAVPAVVGGQAWRMNNRRAEEQRLRSARGCDNSSDELCVCEGVCTSKTMLKKISVHFLMNELLIPALQFVVFPNLILVQMHVPELHCLG